MEEKFCIRGCVSKAHHLPTCSEVTGAAHLMGAIFGRDPDPCQGCAPRKAYYGTQLCTPCIARVRSAITQAAELCGHLRTLIDPRKSGWNFDREQLSGGKASAPPAPANVAVIDAADEVISTLTWWAAYYGDEQDYQMVSGGFPSWISPELAYDIADSAVSYLLDAWDEIKNDQMAGLFAEKIIGNPTDPDEWSIQKALDRFPMDDRAHWSKMPCPDTECRRRTVLVTPPTTYRALVWYQCKTCGWEPPILEHATFAAYFNGETRK